MNKGPDINDTLCAPGGGEDAVRARAAKATKFDGAQAKHDKAETPARFTLKPFDTVEHATMPNYLVKGLVPRQALTVIWGPPKSGKSFWTFDLFMHVALGRAYRGRKVQGGPVVYLALEGGGGFRARVVAWREKLLGDDDAASVPFYLLAVPVDLVVDCNDLIAAIKEQAIAPVAVVVDTLNRSLAGSENNPEDMAAFIHAADAIRAAFNCAVAVIHHCGVDAKRPRGHTSLTGAADAQIAIERDDQTGVIQAKIEFMKDGESGATILSKLKPVEIGIDDDGDVIDSCVIEPTDQPAATSPSLTKNQRSLFAVLHDAGSAGLTTKEWNERARDIGIGASRAADLYDLRSALKGKRLVRQYGDRWTVDHQSP